MVIGTTYTLAVASLDCCGVDERADLGPLHNWYFNGDHPIVDEDNADVHRASFQVSAASGDYVRSMWSCQKPGGDIYVYGSPSLLRSLLAAELVDELILMIEPMTLGGGKILFPNDGTMRRFALISAQTATTGVQVRRYQSTH